MASDVRTMAGNAEKGGRRRWSRWRIAGWAAGAFMLLQALVAKQFIGEVSWVDNLAQTGALLIGVGIAVELASRKTGEAAKPHTEPPSVLRSAQRCSSAG